MTLTPLAPARGSGAPSTVGRSQRDTSSAAARGRAQTYSLALAAELDGALVGQLARREQDFLLRRLDVREAHRALGLEVVLEHLGRALRHVLEDLGLEGLVGALERDAAACRPAPGAAAPACRDRRSRAGRRTRTSGPGSSATAPSSVLPMSVMSAVPTDESSRLTISAATCRPPSAELLPAGAGHGELLLHHVVELAAAPRAGCRRASRRA